MSAAAPILLAVALGGLMMHFLPSMSRPDIFFAVTVPYEFRLDHRARAIRREYWLLVWTVTLLGSAVAVFGPKPGSMLASMGTQFVGSWIAWAIAHRRVKPFALVVRPASPRVASLEPRTLGIPGGPVVAAIPLLIIAGSALLLWMNWEQIPDRFPSRWSSDGTPTGWRTRTVGGVFGPLVMAAAVTTMMLWMAHAIPTATRQVAAAGNAARLERRFKRGNAVYFVLSAYCMAILFALMGVRPVLAHTTRLPLGIWIILAVVMILGFGLIAWMYWLGQGGRRQVPVDEVVPPGDGSSDDGWKAGMFYYNPGDPALLVERRMGWGWTLNFGHRVSWLIVAVLLVATIGPIVIRLVR
jgi:uncharacterized membrane protein